MTRPRCERPPRICDGCGVQFRRRPRPSRRTFCSADCYRNYQAAHRKAGGAENEDDGGAADEMMPPADADCPYCRQPLAPEGVGHGAQPGTGWRWCRICGGFPGSWVRIDSIDRRLADLRGPTMGGGP